MIHIKSYQTLCAFGHFCSDINQSALSAILPFLIAAYHYDYTTAAFLVLASNIIGSVVQPILGQLSDTHNRPWIMPAGLFLAGGGMALTGIITDFYGLCLAVMLSGIGIAMFHPQGALLVNRVSTEENRGLSLSIFAFGGNMGFTVGPLLVTGAVSLFGLPGTLVFFIPEIIICTLIALLYPKIKALGDKKIQKKEGKGTSSLKPDQWPSFIKLCVTVFGRSIIFYGVNTFVVLYFIHELGQTRALGNSILSLYYGIGAISTLAGGKLADKYGCRTVARLGFCLFFPALLLMTFMTDIYSAALFLFITGIAVSLVYSPLVVLGQQYLPNRVGLASGVTLGLSVSIGGIAAPFLGKVADTFGLPYAFYTICAVSLIPLIFSFLLSEPEKRENIPA